MHRLRPDRLLTAVLDAVFTEPASERPEQDRGDVPGWVLITIMTAGLVVGLWAIAGTAFTEMFQDALDKVRLAGQ